MNISYVYGQENKAEKEPDPAALPVYGQVKADSVRNMSYPAKTSPLDGTLVA